MVHDREHGRGQCVGISRWYQDAGISNDFRQCPAGGADDGHAAGHGFSNGQAESFIDRWNNRGRGHGVLPDKFFIADASGKRNNVLDAQLVNKFGNAAVFFGFPMTISETGRVLLILPWPVTEI